MINSARVHSIHFGLYCLFVEEGIALRTTTAKTLSTMTRKEQLGKISSTCRHNPENLLWAVRTVHRLGIGAFRIMSPLFPRMTHPDVSSLTWINFLTTTRSRNYSPQLGFSPRKTYIRLSFHPDQFVVLSSSHSAVVANSIRELHYHGRLADTVGAEVINLHAGGVYGDKSLALEPFYQVF